MLKTLVSGIIYLLIFALSVTAINAQVREVNPNDRVKEQPYISFVSFPSADTINGLNISGELRVPKTDNQEKLAAILVVHGSSGVDSRGAFYIERLNDAGYITLEIDMWAPRGWSGGITGRPAGVPETLPDAFGALHYLAALENVNADKIGIVGFSWGGVVAMLTSTSPYRQQWSPQFSFAAHVAHYPVCWVYNTIPGYSFDAFTGAPLLIQAGALDNYDKPESCQNLLNGLSASDRQNMKVNLYQDATHAWDRLEPQRTVFDPFACLGAGCEVDFIANPDQAIIARNKMVEFLNVHLITN